MNLAPEINTALRSFPDDNEEIKLRVASMFGTFRAACRVVFLSDHSRPGKRRAGHRLRIKLHDDLIRLLISVYNPPACDQADDPCLRSPGETA
jgi:hypothetical protein